MFKDLSADRIFRLSAELRALTPDRRAYVQAIVDSRYARMRSWLKDHSASSEADIQRLQEAFFPVRAELPQLDHKVCFLEH